MPDPRPTESSEPELSFAEEVNERLRPAGDRPLRVLDLFAGCGGLALGFESAGFETIGFESNADCVESYRHNLQGECHLETLTSDTDLSEEASVVIGGPPCQPFSVRGSQKGSDDSRNGFPAFINVVEQVSPELVMAENVRGMLYRNRQYLDEVIVALEKLGYKTDVQLMNARNYGVPQNRERVIIVGYRDTWEWPTPATDEHVTAGEALGPMMEEVPQDSKFLTASMDRYVAEYERKSKCVRPRDLHPDRPARTLTCRNLAGATSDMHRIRLSDGRRRRLLPHEAARLQSFPDWFEFVGTESSVFNQIGNAVAPLFARALALQVREALTCEAPGSDVAREASGPDADREAAGPDDQLDDARQFELASPST